MDFHHILVLPTAMIYYLKTAFYYYSKFTYPIQENIKYFYKIISLEMQRKVKNIEKEIAGKNEKKMIIY